MENMQSDFQYQPDGPTLKKGQIVHFVRNLADPTLYTAFKLRSSAPGLHTRFLEKDVRAVVYQISSEKTNIDSLPERVQCYTLRFTLTLNAGRTFDTVPRTYFTPRQEDEDLPDESQRYDAPFILGFDAVDPIQLISTRNSLSMDWGPCQWGTLGDLKDWRDDFYSLDSKETRWTLPTYASFTYRTEYKLGPYLLEIEPETETRYAKVKAWPHYIDHTVFCRHVGDTIRWGRDPDMLPPNLEN